MGSGVLHIDLRGESKVCDVICHKNGSNRNKIPLSGDEESVSLCRHITEFYLVSVVYALVITFIMKYGT